VSIISGFILILISLRLILWKNRDIFIFIACFGLFLIASFRSPYFGSDTIHYVYKYFSFQYIDFSVFWVNIFNSSIKDPTFYLLGKVISMIGINAQGWLSILSFLFISNVYRLICKYSGEPLLSFVALISLGYFYFTLTGLRQGLAISIILFSFEYLKNRRLILFFVSVSLAALFHSSALIFLIAYPLVCIEARYEYLVGALLAFIVSFFMGDAIRFIVGTIGWTKYLSAYSVSTYSLSYAGFIIQFLVLTFCLIYRKQLSYKNDENIILYNLLFIGLVFQAFSSVIAEFFRLSMYFSIFSILLIPNAILAEENKKLRVIQYLAIFTALVSYVFWSNQFSGFSFFS